MNDTLKNLVYYNAKRIVELIEDGKIEPYIDSQRWYYLGIVSELPDKTELINRMKQFRKDSIKFEKELNENAHAVYSKLQEERTKEFN